MKNSTKAVIAGGVGVVLLLGGAGTIAYWTDEADGGNGTISAGTLDLGDVAGGGWTISHQGDGSGDSTSPVTFDPASNQIVPGDTLTYTQSVPVELAGENIAAQFDGAIAVNPTSEAPADAELADAIVGQELAATGITDADGLSFDAESGVLTGEGTGTVDVTTTVIFPWGEQSEFNEAQLGSLAFSVDYVLTQVPGN